ncbi:10313_t:CDS:2, partial [Gigaspora rosea]
MSTNYILEYFERTLNQIQTEVYNNTQDYISFAEALAEERLKWRFRINAVLTIVSILITIAIDVNVKLINDEYIGKDFFILLLNCIIFGGLALNTLIKAAYEVLYSDRIFTSFSLLFPLLIGTLLAIFLGIYFLPPPMTITWIFVGLIFSNISITYRYTSYRTKVKFAVAIL